MLGAKIAHFRVLEKVGEGGVGAVYKAWDEKLHRQVALKVLRPEFLAEVENRRRFLREARAAAAVPHPNIAAIHELGEENDTVFIVMEFVEGRTIHDLLRAGRLAIPEVLRLGSGIAQGLSRAHRSGVVHRDLKPRNVIVGPDGLPKILDFGLAKFFGASDRTGPSAPHETGTRDLTEEGKVLGTAAYMSPEQARGDPVDARSDVFSFGVMLYEMSAAEHPFARPTWVETLAATLHHTPPPATARNPDIPAELQRILGRCLEKEPRNRYQDSRDLALDLRLLLESRGPEPRSRDIATRVRGWRRTHVPRWIVWMAGSVLLAGVIGVAAWVISGLRKTSPQVVLKQLTDLPNEAEMGDCSISPDGESLAYLAFGELQMLRVDTGETQRFPVPENRVGDEGLAWFPDGTKLLGSFSKQEGDKTTWEYWSLTFPGGTWRKLSETALFAAVSPDGTLIAFTAEDEKDHHSIWLMGAHGEEPRKILATEGNLGSPAWSPNGKRLAYLRYERGPASVESCDLEGRDVQLVVAKAEVGEGRHVAWLRDGRLLYQVAEPAPRGGGSQPVGHARGSRDRPP